MNDKPSEGAMRAVDQIIDSIIRGMKLAHRIPQEPEIAGLREAGKKEWAAIIDEETRQDWIECAEQMPTEDHGDINGRILWRFDDDDEVFHYAAHFDPTNIDGIKRVWDMYEIECVSWMPFPPGPKEEG